MDQVLDFFRNLFDSSDWPPRWHCGKWSEFHGWLYIISDLLIWSAYFAIPIVIIKYISRKKNIQFTKLYFLFAAFILACGATHFLDAVAFWIPVYRLSALVRFITGVISWVTVFYLVKRLPVIFSLRSQSALEAEIAERKKTEQALKKSRKDYELLVGGVKDYAIFMLDAEGLVASWNSGAENIKGYTSAEIVGKPIDVFYTAEELQQDAPRKNLQQALMHGKFETEGWRVRKDGTLFWADVVYTALYDEDKLFYGYAKITKDITEKRKTAEHILFLASIASNIQDPYISTDNDGMITRWNKAAELLLEWTAEEVIGKSGASILQVDYLGTTRESILASLKQKNYWQGEVIYQTKSGKPVNVLITASQLRDAEDKVVGNLALVRDITERKKAEEKIKESEILYSTLFYDSPGMKAISEASTGKYLDINLAFASFLERPKEEIVGKTSIELNMITHPEVRKRSIKQLREQGLVRDMEMHIISASGKKRWVSISADLIKLDGKDCFLSDAVDITARKEAETNLIQLNAELEQRVIERTELLEKNEKKFRALIENTFDIVSLNDETLKPVYLSPSSARVTGWSDEYMKDYVGADHIHIEDREKVTGIVQIALKNPGKAYPYLCRYLHKNGYYIWLEGTVTKLPEDSSVKGLVFNSRDVTDRVELEQLLNKANTLARIGSWEIDLVKGTVYWSDITKQIHETGRDYVPDLSTGIQFYKEGPDRDLITQKVKEAVELGIPWDVELQIVTAKNNERWIRTIGETEFADGKCVRLYGSFQDIDERKKSEIERERLNERLQLATQSAQLGLWDWDVKNNQLIWDEGMYRLYNISENEFSSVYEGWASRVHADDRQRVDSEIQMALLGKKEYNPEFRIVWKDSSVHYIKASGLVEKDSEGNLVRMTGFNWDVTEQKKAEEAILASEEKFRQTFERISDGFVAVDKNWNYTYMNKKAAEITRQDPQLIVGKNLWKQFPDLIGSPFYKAYHQAMEEQKYVYLQEHYPAYDQWFENHIYPSPDGLSVYFTNITERKKTEEKIRNINIELEQKVASRTEELKKTNEELEAFSYSVSHDLRAPLRGIIGFTNILEEDYSSKLDDEARRITSVIKNNTIKMGNLIDDLLSFSRLGRLPILKTLVNSNEIIKDVIAEFGQKNTPHHVNWMITDLPIVAADLNTIKQVWTNLISNAVKYSFKIQKPVIEIGSIARENETVFFIKDNGVGFDAKYKDKLFKVFQRLHSTAEFEGTGVGLAIVEKIITKHGGRVWAEAEPGKGACFYFSLPDEPAII